MTRSHLKGSLTPLTPEELEVASVDERRAEAWYLVMTGRTMKSVAEQFGVSPTTIRNWIDAVARQRRSRTEEMDLEVERLVGQCEAVAIKAWENLNAVAPNSMTGPSYLKTVLESVQTIARLRGLDGAKKDPTSTKSTTVVVRFGGAAGGGKEQPIHAGAIDVAVQERETVDA